MTSSGLRAARVAALLLATSVGSATALPAASPSTTKAPRPAAPQFPSTAVYYYNGESRVDLVVALDEISVAPAEGSSAAKSADWHKSLRADLADLFGADAILTDTPGSVIVRLPAATSQKSIAEKTAELAKRNSAWEARAVLYSPGAAASRDAKPASRRILTRRLSLGLHGSADATTIANRYNARIVEKVPFMPNGYIAEVSSDDPLAALHVANTIKENESGVAFASPLIARQHSLRATFNDPLYASQWHLNNSGEQVPNSIPNMDVNIDGVWDNFTGAGVNIAIVDDGVELTHEDLAANVRTDIDRDINGNDNDASAGNSDFHGTACAGMAAAVANNAKGVIGAAFGAKIVPVRLIAAETTDQQEANGLSHQTTAANNADRVHISSNSWGPSDDGATLETWGSLTRAAIENAITNGRGGLGTIFVWAGGNGREALDNVNHDGYASSRYTIAVGASSASGAYSYYSEPGAALLVNVGSSYEDPIGAAGTTTVDRTGGLGYDPGNYTTDFGGTSSSAPLAAGIVALILQANPNLTWRDVQHILVHSTFRNDPEDAGWATNGAGLKFNHSYGFGRINAGRAIELAQNWANVPANATPLLATNNTSLSIPDGTGTFATRQLSISGPADFVTEHVELTLSISHAYRGDLRIELVSPTGMVSTLTEPRNDSNSNYSSWLFTSVAHWGENPNGNWAVRIRDEYTPDAGTLTAATLRIHGYQRGQTTPVPIAVNRAPGNPGLPSPAMHAILSHPADDPDGEPVRYIFEWTSSGDDAPVVREPKYSPQDWLLEGEGGATFTPGELWTVNVLAMDEAGAISDTVTRGQFRIEDDGTITFTGWMAR